MIGGVILTEWFLPFLLVFVIVFAILQKSKVLGDQKAQIDALASLATAILAISVPYSRMVIAELMPWLGVGIAALFVFFVLYSFIVGEKFMEETWLKYVLLGLVSIFSIGVIFHVTGFWDLINPAGRNLFDSEVVSSIIFLVIMAVVVFWVVKTSSSGGSNNK